MSLRKKFKRVLLVFLNLLGVTSLVFHRQFRDRKKILILLYHRICQPENFFQPAVSPERFEEQIRFISQHFEVVSTSRMFEIMDKKQLPQKPLAVITFDDGYRDNLETAYPILKKYNVPATIFLATESLEGAPMWTSRVEAMFKNTAIKNLTVESLSKERTFELGSYEDRMKICHEVKSEMKQVPDSHRQTILEELEERMGGCKLSAEMLSWDDVRQMMQDPLIEFGSHSVSHRMLANLSLPEILSELEQSKEKIRNETGKEPCFISYPGNSYDVRVEKAAEQVGYEAAFAVDQELADFSQNRFSIKRVHIEDEPLYSFRAEICLITSFFRRLFGRKKLFQ